MLMHSLWYHPFLGGYMNNIDDIKKELKKLREELFQIKFEIAMTKDEYTLNKLKIKEEEILKQFKKLSFDKVTLEEKKGRER